MLTIYPGAALFAIGDFQYTILAEGGLRGMEAEYQIAYWAQLWQHWLGVLFQQSSLRDGLQEITVRRNNVIEIRGAENYIIRGAKKRLEEISKLKDIIYTKKKYKIEPARLLKELIVRTLQHLKHKVVLDLVDKMLQTQIQSG